MPMDTTNAVSGAPYVYSTSTDDRKVAEPSSTDSTTAFSSHAAVGTAAMATRDRHTSSTVCRTWLSRCRSGRNRYCASHRTEANNRLQRGSQPVAHS